MEKIAANITRAIRTENASLDTIALWRDYAIDADIDPQETPIIWFDLMKLGNANLNVRVAIQIKGSTYRVLFNNFQSGTFDHRFMLANSDDKISGVTKGDFTEVASKIVKEFNEHFAA